MKTEYQQFAERDKKLVEWLKSFPMVSVAREIVVTIKGTRYKGAAYRDSNFNNEWRYYLLGSLPACYRRSYRTAFVIDGADWYIACYMTDDRILATNSEFHPCGNFFMLCRWGVPDGTAIDRYESRPYNRVDARLDPACDLSLADEREGAKP